MLETREIGNGLILEKGKVYEAVETVGDKYKVVVPMKQKGKFRYALVKDSEGVLV